MVAITTGASRPAAAAHFPLALRPLLASVALNMIAPALVYRLAAPHAPAGSLTPLILSALPVAASLGFNLLRLRAIDFLAFFAAENVVVDLAAALLAHDERGALLGRALENPILALVFLGSLATSRPLVQRMVRQLSTGNDPDARVAFEAQAAVPRARRAYRLMTWIWTVALMIKGCGAALLALHLDAQVFLLASPLWGLGSDAALVAWTVAYGRKALTAGPASSD